ncbi:cupin-like domain-containing protein [Chitinophaga japonensis]|uniref:Cupin-like domain-containing protein n=1 Tax=Chitinophaga japonensis TaxID=104662 RepID=A0A562T776_CHIJA|nr:cupin-like domain-containing protein [Chitinophaga japonensis]TWI89203.1 Cupin-like domain-containing protein [Chitinophaga japonensis]
MNIVAIDRVDEIAPDAFRQQYYEPRKPLVITGLSRQWPAREKWTWEHFKSIVGDQTVGVYNNERAGAGTPVNGADNYIRFGDYLDMIQQGPVTLRIFLFNIFRYAPDIVQDFTWPDHLVKGLLRKYPMLFVGGAGSVAHMHYDIDLSHIFHTQFLGRKRVLLLENNQSPYIYRMPFTVESAASFVDWHKALDTEQFPALKYANGYTTILHHGDTLFMPGGYWHHMEYMDSGFAMSLRALDQRLSGKLNGLYHIVGLRGMNNLLIRLAPQWWYHYKRRMAHRNAQRVLRN